MKKITLLFALLLATFGWQANAQLAPDDTCTTAFEDISSTGTALGLSDDGEENITIPFAFTLDGVSSSDLRVGNNGGVLFGVTTGNVSVVSSPTAIGFYPFADDIDNDYGDVYWETLGTAPNRRVVIQWNDRPHYNNSPSGATFELILYETTNEVSFVYQDLDFGAGNTNNDGASAGILIVGANGTYTYSTDTALPAGVTCIHWTIPQIYNPVFTLATNADCANSQFSIDVNITDFGGATSVTVSDDQGSTTQQATATGTVTMGPYPSGTNVTITVTNEQDNNYVASNSLEYICPPANDDISGAIPITPSPEGTSCNSSNYTFQAWTANSGVTDSGLDGTCDSTYTGLDVFYSWTATSIGLVWNDGAGNPGIIIRDAATGNEITCEGTYASDDTVLSGWNIGDNLIIQIYDFSTADVDVSFCLAEKNTFNPTFTNSTSIDCANNQFSIDVNVTDFGGATSVTVSDDQGSATQQLTALGTVTFGPYAFGTDVAITVTNDQDNTYAATHNATVGGCPPANDECDNAVALTVNPYDTCDVVTSASNQFATASPQPDNVSGYPTDDVWFSFVATQTEHVIALTNITAITGTSTDMGIGLYDATNGCNDLVFVATSDPETMTASNLTVGNTYLVRVYGWWDDASSAQVTFDICVRTTIASIEDNQIAGFKFYPNPVNNSLNLSAQDNIEKVSIYNISGQEVMNITPNAMQTQVDMSRLQNGIYFVKAQINGQLTAFKIVKK